MFTYIGLIKLTDEGRENLEKAPEYLDRFRVIIEEEGGKLEKTFAIMGPLGLLRARQVPGQRGCIPRPRKDWDARGHSHGDVPGRGGRRLPEDARLVESLASL